MTNLTIEETCRVFEKLGLFKTQGGVRSLCQLRQLQTEPCNENDRRYSKYGYRVSANSLIEYLTEQKHFSQESVLYALPAHIDPTK